MEAEELEKGQEKVIVDQEQVKIKLTRGMKGAYGWDITVNGPVENTEKVKSTLTEFDDWLKENYSEGSG